MAVYKSNNYDGRYLQLTVTQNGEYINWTLESIGGSSKYYTIYNLHVKINGETVFGADGQDYVYNTNNTLASNPFPVSTGSVSGSVYIGKAAATVPVYFYGAVYNTGYCKDYGGSFEFSAQQYTITYDANGGTNAPQAQTADYGYALYITTENPVRKSYQFIGWNTSTDGTGDWYYANNYYYNNATSIILYAQWKLTYNVNINNTWVPCTIKVNVNNNDVNQWKDCTIQSI